VTQIERGLSYTGSGCQHMTTGLIPSGNHPSQVCDAWSQCKLGTFYPVFQAVDPLPRDWECDKPGRLKDYALHPSAMTCLPHLPHGKSWSVAFKST
jgi:hypothetical protein